MRYRNIGEDARRVVSMGKKVLVDPGKDVEMRAMDVAHSGSSMAFFELAVARETVKKEHLAETSREVS